MQIIEQQLNIGHGRTGGKEHPTTYKAESGIGDIVKILNLSYL